MFSLRLNAPEFQQCLWLEILFDDTGNDPHCHAALLVNVGDCKADVILFSRHTPVIAGVGHGIDAIGQTDINNAFVDVGDFSRIFALDTAFLEIVAVGVFGDTLNIRLDG